MERLRPGSTGTESVVISTTVITVSAPGFTRLWDVFIQPQLVKGISWVNAAKETPFGMLDVKWEKTDVSFTLDLSIPVGCKATVLLPVKAKSVSINDVKSDKLDQLEMQSGDYRITCVL